MSEIGTWATLASGGACGPKYGRSRSLYVPKDLVTSTLQQLCSGEQARGRACGVLDTCCDLRCRYALLSLSSRTCVVDKLCEVSVARTYFSGCGAPPLGCSRALVGAPALMGTSHLFSGLCWVLFSTSDRTLGLGVVLVQVCPRQGGRRWIPLVGLHRFLARGGGPR